MAYFSCSYPIFLSFKFGDQRSEIDPGAKLDKQHGSSNFDLEQYREMLDDVILMS